MASGSFYKEFYSGGSTKYRITAEWSSSGDYSSNTSDVDVVLKLYCPYEIGLAAKTGTIVIDGTSYSISMPRIPRDASAGKTFTLGSASKTVSHNSNGEKSISISFSVPILATIISTWIDTVSGSSTATLDSLSGDYDDGGSDYEPPDYAPSTIACGDGYIGDTVNITLTKDSSYLYSTITYELDNVFDTIVSKTRDSKITWTIPTSLYPYLSNKLETELTLKCDTYTSSYSSSPIGTEETTILIKVNPETNKPVITNAVATNPDTTLTGNADTFIRYMSNANASFTVAAQNSATITETSITCGSATIKGTTAVFNKVESPTFIFTATDSRGLSSSVEITKNIIEYIRLTCNLDLRPPSAEGVLNTTVKGNFYEDIINGAQNTLTLQYRWKIEGGEYSEWITMTPSISDNSYYAPLYQEGLNYKSTYIYQARAVDALLEVITAEIPMRTTPVFDWGRDDFQFNVPVRFNEEVVFADGSSVEGGDIDLSDYATIEYVDSAIANAQLSGGGSTGGGSEGGNIPSVSGDQKVLWQGALFPVAGDTITLSEGISQQPNGIVLVFSRCNLIETGVPSPSNEGFQSVFFSRKQIELTYRDEQIGYCSQVIHLNYLLANTVYTSIKQIKFKSDTTISGNSDYNGRTVSGNNGITYDNDMFCLRYVIGV